MLDFNASTPGEEAQTEATISSARSHVTLPHPAAYSDTRPKIDAVLARDTWQRTEHFFRSIQCGVTADVVSTYLPDAILDHPIIGHISGRDIRQLWETFLRRTGAHQLDFTITSVSASTAFVDWTTEHEFFDTGRAIRISGASSLTFEHGRIKYHHDFFDRHLWSAQAMGFSGLILSYLPGSRSFLRDESRRVFGLSNVRA